MFNSAKAPPRDLVFISYSHKDKKWLNRLLIFLKPYVKQGQINIWADPYIQIGDRWQRRIGEALPRTKVAVLMVSSNFLASDFINEEELPPLLASAGAGEVKLFCIPISASLYEATELAGFQWAWDPEQPLDSLKAPMRNKAMVGIIKKLAALLPSPDQQRFQTVVKPSILKLDEISQKLHGKEKSDVRGKLHGVPPQRPHYMSRDEDHHRLKEILLGDRSFAAGITGSPFKLGLHGQGGMGKSVLAIAIVNDEQVRQAFPDGVYWITLGQKPDILKAQETLLSYLRADVNPIVDVAQGKQALTELLTDKSCLLVLDDLWEPEHAEAFNVLSAKSRFLITTRDATLLTAFGARELRLEVLSKPLARTLLARWADLPPEAIPEIADDIAEHCDRVPLALSLAGARVRDGMSWEDVLAALKKGDLEFLDHPYGSIFKTMRVSLDALPQEAVKRYLELAIFPEDMHIPATTVYRLWRMTGNLDAAHCRSLLAGFERKGMLYFSDDEADPGISFHDLQKDFQRLLVEDAPQIHSQLVDAYISELSKFNTPGPTEWHLLPEHETYMWTNLAYHLSEAGRANVLTDLVKDLRYVARKLFLFQIHGVENDLQAAGDVAPQDSQIEVLRRNLARTAHLLGGFRRQEDLSTTLYSRLSNFPALGSLVKKFEEGFNFPHLRNIWPMPDLADSMLLRTLEGHSDSITCCAVDPYGKWFVSGSDDRSLRVWDTTTGYQMCSHEGHSHWITCCAIDPLGKWIASGSRDRTIRIWDPASGNLLRSLVGHEGSVNCCATDPQGKWIVSGSNDRTVRVWDVENGILLRTLVGHTGAINCCAVVGQGTWFASGAVDRTVRIWDAATGDPWSTLEGHTDLVNCCAIDPQGKWIVSGSKDRTLRVWDTMSGKLRFSLKGHAASVECCAVDPEGKRIVSGSWDRTLRLWNATNGELLRTLEGHADSVNCCAIDPEGKRIVSGSWDNTIRVWDATSEQRADRLEGHSSWLTSCAVDTQGKLIVAGVRDRTLRLWDAKSGVPLGALEGHEEVVNSCGIDPQGKWIVSASDDGTLRVWDVKTASLLRTLEGHSDSVNCCGIDASGGWIVSGALDCTLVIWDSNAGQISRTLKGHSSSVNCCAIAPNGKWIVSGADDGTLRVWDVATGGLLRTLEVPADSVNCCAIDPSGGWVVAGSDSRNLLVMDPISGNLLHTLTGHTDSVNCCAIDSCGRWILSGADDRTLRVWDAHSGESVLMFKVDGDLRGCVWFRNSRRIIGAGARGLYVLEYIPGVAELPADR